MAWQVLKPRLVVVWHRRSEKNKIIRYIHNNLFIVILTLEEPLEASVCSDVEDSFVARVEEASIPSFEPQFGDPAPELRDQGSVAARRQGLIHYGVHRKD